jgi:hypothetical protein
MTATVSAITATATCLREGLSAADSDWLTSAHGTWSKMDCGCFLCRKVLVVIPTLFCVCACPCRRPLLEGHHLVLGVWTAVLFTAAVTNIIKCPVGRLRPDFNARWVCTPCVIPVFLTRVVTMCVTAGAAVTSGWDNR